MSDFRVGESDSVVLAGHAYGIEWFALLACADGKLAGKLRFFPKTLTRAHFGGWSEDEHRRDWSDDILWIGSAYVDPTGIPAETAPQCQIMELDLTESGPMTMRNSS